MLVSANRMGLAGIRHVNSVQSLGNRVVGQVLHLPWGGVMVVVSFLTMATEAVGVFNTKVKILHNEAKFNEILLRACLQVKWDVEIYVQTLSS